METKKDDGPEKTRFVVVRDEIYKWYTTQQKAKVQVVSSALKRSITQPEEEGEVIEMDGDVTSPSAVKQTHLTLVNRLMKRTTVEEFINTVSHQKTLALFRKISDLPVFAEIGATEPLKYADTRYGSRVLMGRCLLATRSIYRNLMVDTEMEA